MPETESLDYLDTQLAEQIAGFDSSRQFYRKQQFTFAMATAVLSAATTVTIAAEKMLKWEFLALISLICSASITVIAAYDQFLRSRDLWIQKTDTWMELQNLQANIQYAVARSGSLTQEEIDRFYARFDKILMSEHESWKKVRASQGEQPRSIIVRKKKP